MIHQFYQELLPVVPEYLAAINICLVKGWIRPATLVEPIIRGTVINFSQLEPITRKYGLASKRWRKSLLVYQPELQQLIDELDPNQVDHEKFGQVLGYRCPGDLMISGATRHQIDFIVENPASGSENPLIAYICAQLTQDLLDGCIDDALEAAKFLRQHQIASSLKLKIWHRQDGVPIVDFDQWF